MKRMRLLTGAALLALATNAWADFNDGAYAYARGDYTTALQTLMPLAQTSNHALAQYYIGIMYMKGQGVDQSYEEASRWLTEASKKGIAQAQYKLGELYVSGQGVPQDFESAYAWFSVAQKLGHKMAGDARNKAAEKLSQDELGEASRLADEYIKEYGKPPEEVKKAP